MEDAEYIRLVIDNYKLHLEKFKLRREEIISGIANMELLKKLLEKIEKKLEDLKISLVERVAQAFMEGAEQRTRRLTILIYKVTVYTRRLYRIKVIIEKARSELLKKMFEETEDLEYLNSTRAEHVGEVVNSLGNEQWNCCNKVDQSKLVSGGDEGKRYVVNCLNKVDQSKLVSGTRVTLETQTLTILRILPPTVHPLVYNMLYRARGDVSYSDLGGLSNQLRDLRDYIELPLTNPELIKRVGIKPPKGVLLYGPPGMGKTLLARAIASNTGSTFMTVVSSEIVSKYLGDSALLLREMFQYARDHQPCIIFMDEIDAIARRRSTTRQVKTRECDRLLFELLSQLDGFNKMDKVQVIMATNRLEFLDPALLSLVDKKIEIPLPDGDSRRKILEIHASGMAKQGEIDYQKVVKLSEGFNGADMRNICTEAGMLAIRANRDYVVPNDFIWAVIKLSQLKKLESKRTPQS